MANALDGVLVLEVADYITGPYAGMLLADMGAEVVKIEKRPTGDLICRMRSRIVLLFSP